MIGVSNKIFLALLIFSFTISCVETETRNQEYSEVGRYEVIERKTFYYGVPQYHVELYEMTYYLLDTKTGDIQKIDWDRFEKEEDLKDKDGGVEWWNMTAPELKSKYKKEELREILPPDVFESMFPN